MARALQSSGCTVGEVDYRIQMNPDKVKTYHINMLKRYFYRDIDFKEVVIWSLTVQLDQTVVIDGAEEYRAEPGSVQ